MAANTACEAYHQAEIFECLDQIIWNGQPYQVTDLIDFRISMPILTRVISAGSVETKQGNSADSNQFYWLQERRTIKRVVATDRHGNHIIFPLNCPILFRNLDSIGKTYDCTTIQFLDDILEKYEMPLKVKPCLDKLSFKSATLNAKALPLAWFSDITLLKSYELDTILAVDISNNKINPAICCLFKNRAEQFKIASGLPENGKHTFDSLKEEMKLQIEEQVNFESFTDNCSEIFVYSPKVINLAGPGRVNYEYLTCQTLRVVLKPDAYMSIQPKRMNGRSKTLPHSQLTEIGNDRNDDGWYSTLNVSNESTKTKPLPPIPRTSGQNLQKTQDKSDCSKVALKPPTHHGPRAGTIPQVPTPGQSSIRHNLPATKKKEPVALPCRKISSGMSLTETEQLTSSGSYQLKISGTTVDIPGSPRSQDSGQHTNILSTQKSFPGLETSNLLSRVSSHKPLPSIPVKIMNTKSTDAKTENKPRPDVPHKVHKTSNVYNSMSPARKHFYHEVKDDSSSLPAGRIQKSSDIPSDISTLSEEQVIDCLHLLKLDKYKEQFDQNNIDGEIFSALDQEILTQELGMSKLDAIKLVKFLNERWLPQGTGQQADGN